MSVAGTVRGRVVGEQLAPGGIPIERLAARVGSTPFFAYDRALVAHRISAVRAALPADVELNYAVKANPMAALLQHLSGQVDGFDVASGTELRHALDTPVAPARVSFAGPGKTDPELIQAVAAGVTIELESIGELARVKSVSTALQIPARVALRVNPDFTVRARECASVAGRSSSASTVSRCRRCWQRFPTLGWSSRDSTSSRAPRTCAPTACARRNGEPSS